MQDIYDEAIKHLTDHPELIDDAWESPRRYWYGCLFRVLADPDSDLGMYMVKGKTPGCPMQINNMNSKLSPRNYTSGIEDLDLYIQTLTDDFPVITSDIRSDHLPMFADLQRKADRLNERKHPNEYLWEGSGCHAPYPNKPVAI
jgi:hypothetical protein